MRLRDRRSFTKPEVMIIPMIDIMFFLLVFFMLATLHMVNLKTIDIALPHAAHAQTQVNVQCVVTLAKNGALHMDGQAIERQAFLQKVYLANRQNNNFSLVIRVESDTNYNLVMQLLDECKGVGISRIGLAAAKGGN